MERVRANRPEPNKQGLVRLHLQFPGDDQAVRNALSTTVAELSDFGHSAELQSTAELVLAEVLNNIVEHAYADHHDGAIEVDITETGGELRVCVQDKGLPMPQGVVPAGDPQNLNVALEDLPEGGYGWFLIHELTVGLHYRRLDETHNELCFRVPIPAHGIDPKA